MATADLSVLVLGRAQVGASDYIAEIQRRLRRQDRVRFRMHAMGTSLEGSTADILAVAAELHAVPFEQGAPRVYTVLKLDRAQARRAPRPARADARRQGTGGRGPPGRRGHLTSPRSTASLLSVLLALSLAACGGGNDEPQGAATEAPAEEGAPVGDAATPNNCMLKAGLESIEKPSRSSWTAFHPDGYAVRVRRFGSPAAANAAVEAAPGIAEQANFFGVFGPVEDEANGATLKVARCLRAF